MRVNNTRRFLMFIYGTIIFILLFIIIRSLVVHLVCKFCNVEYIFKTKKRSICINIFTNVVTIIFACCGYMILVQIGA